MVHPSRKSAALQDRHFQCVVSSSWVDPMRESTSNMQIDSNAAVFDSFGEHFSKNRFGDEYLYSVNRYAFNGNGADMFYRTFFGERLFDESSLYVFAGSDSGLLAQHLLKNRLPAGTFYL